MMRQWLWSEIGEVIILIKTITNALSFSPVEKKFSFCLAAQILSPQIVLLSSRSNHYL